MGWKPLRFNRNVEELPWVRIGVHGTGAGYGQIKITISATVANFLGLEAGGYVHLSRGFGDHQGWIRIAKGEEGDTGYHIVTKSSRNVQNGNVAVKVSARFLNLESEKIKTMPMLDVVPVPEEDVEVWRSEDGKRVRIAKRRVVSCELPEQFNKGEGFDPLWFK